MTATKITALHFRVWGVILCRLQAYCPIPGVMYRAERVGQWGQTECLLVFRGKSSTDIIEGRQLKVLEMPGMCHFPSAHPTWRSTNTSVIPSFNNKACDSPIRLELSRSIHGFGRNPQEKTY